MWFVGAQDEALAVVVVAAEAPHQIEGQQDKGKCKARPLTNDARRGSGTMLGRERKRLASARR